MNKFISVRAVLSHLLWSKSVPSVSGHVSFPQRTYVAPPPPLQLSEQPSPFSPVSPNSPVDKEVLDDILVSSYTHL